jgi:hypothetical protein
LFSGVTHESYEAMNRALKATAEQK